MEFVCVKWGFCNRLDLEDFIQPDGTISAETFARMTLEAEGFMPDHEPKWFRKLRNRFTEHFGSAQIVI